LSEFIGIAGGMLLLITGGVLLVRGASQAANSLGISPMIVGLVVVGFGTSMPELVVNAVSALNNQTELAFGNVVGSNIANLGLVLGAAALISPLKLQGALVRRELPLLILVTTIIAVMGLDNLLDGQNRIIGRSDSIILFLLFSVFVYSLVLDLLRADETDHLLLEVTDHPGTVTPSASNWQWVFILGGCALLYLGGDLTVRSAVGVSAQLGIPTATVGLFVVAIGTSLPELVTSIIAALRGESDLAIGNVIGSNLFNSLVALPASGLIARVPVPDGGITDLAVSWIFAILLIPIFLLGKARLGRPVGAMFLLAYLGYATYRTVGPTLPF
jgi:cation:H+ antiporter